MRSTRYGQKAVAILAERIEPLVLEVLEQRSHRTVAIV